MADEPTEPAAIPAEAGEAAGGAGAEAGAAAPKSKGFKALLVPIIIVAVAVGGGLAFVKFYKPKASGGGSEATHESGKEPAASETGHESAPPAHGAAPKAEGKGETGAAPGVEKRNKDLPVPLTESLIAFKPLDATKPGDADKYVTLDVKGDPQDLAVPKGIVRNVANTSGTKFVVVKLALMSVQDDFVRRVNLKNHHLIAAAGETLGQLTMKQLEQPGIQSLIKSHLVAEFNNILGAGTLQDVLITSFATQ